MAQGYSTAAQQSLPSEHRVFIASDTNAAQEFLYHNAGPSGAGGASYIDEVVLRDRDADSQNNTMEERLWYIQNRRADIVALISNTGEQREMVRYAPYGTPFNSPGGDTDSDGDNDAADQNQIQLWINASAYDVRGDIDLDGDVDSADKTKASSTPILSLAGGRGTLSSFANRAGCAGYRESAALGSRQVHVRGRILNSEIGRWRGRNQFYEQATHRHEASPYEYSTSSPIGRRIPYGMVATLSPVGSIDLPPAGNCDCEPTTACDCEKAWWGKHDFETWKACCSIVTISECEKCKCTSLMNAAQGRDECESDADLNYTLCMSGVMIGGFASAGAALFGGSVCILNYKKERNKCQEDYGQSKLTSCLACKDAHNDCPNEPCRQDADGDGEFDETWDCWKRKNKNEK